MDHSKKPTYLYSIDALRVIAIFSVISIHLSIKVLQTLNHDINKAIVPFIFNQSTRFAVPLFFLISGFVLALNYKNISYYSFFKRRASKVIIPFIFWSFVYIFYSQGFTVLGKINLDFIRNLSEGKASYHLYFIPTLIIFYLLFPLLNRIRKLLSNKFVLILLVGIESYFLYVDFYIKGLDINPNQRIAILSSIMFVLGIVGCEYKDKIMELTERYFKTIAIVFGILFVVMPLHIYDLSTKFHTTRFIYSQYHILNYLYTISFALLFFYLFEKTQFARKYFITLSKLSFFVFFIHVLVQTIVWQSLVVKLIEVLGYGFLNSFWFTPILLIFLSSISFGIAFFAHKIKGLNKITG